MNIFWRFFVSLGIVNSLLYLTAQAVTALLTILLLKTLRGRDAMPLEFVNEFEDLVRQGRTRPAYELAKFNASFLARAVSAGMSRLRHGIEAAREEMRNEVAIVQEAKQR